MDESARKWESMTRFSISIPRVRRQSPLLFMGISKVGFHRGERRD